MKVFIWFKDNMMRLLSGESLPLIEVLIGVITLAIVAVAGIMLCIALFVPVLVTSPIWALVYAFIKTRGKEGGNGD